MQSILSQHKSQLSQKDIDLSELKSTLDREQNNKHSLQRNSDSVYIQNQELKRETTNNVEVIASLKTELERYKTKFDYAQEDIRDLRKKLSLQEESMSDMAKHIRDKDNKIISSDQNKEKEI